MAPSVAEYYSEKTIFITGATGFMGKVLVEKLLRCCPGVKKIYMLMRAKKGQGTTERLEQFLNCKVFEHLHKVSPDVFKKLRVVPGDILAEELGISSADRQELQREAQVVFHCAACVRFDMPLRDALDLNTVGTKRVLELVGGMSKLEVLLHVSTSYCRCELELLEEKVYPAKHRPQDVMECCRWMDDELVSHMEGKLMEPQPNTYAYTKSLTEDLVVQHAGKFPIAIARPSIVTAAFKEPLPGWVDNINGPTGIMIGAGKGVIRTMMCNEDIQADIIPVDMAVNGCILVAYTTAIDKPKEVRVCNVTQSGINPMTWGEALNIGRKHVDEFPSAVCMWYPGGSAKNSWVYHQLALFFTHYLPAYFIDLLLYLLGQKTFMIKVQKRITYGLNVLQYYTVKPWYFKNDFYLSLKNRVSKEDNDTFYTDLELINWDSYLREYMKGAREYCLKEDPSTLPQARRLNRQLYYLDWATKIILSLLFTYFVYKYTVLFLSFFKVSIA
ncbi:male sterility protein domain-containing protein [Phthorimaea operculella]|nr:male sterility protein domain-containing protein [Phthorimaea operculella]